MTQLNPVQLTSPQHNPDNHLEYPVSLCSSESAVAAQQRLAEVDQDHPENVASPKARTDAAVKEEAESKPGAVESEVGQTLDKLI